MQYKTTFDVGDIVTISFRYAEINKVKAYLAGKTGIVSEKPFDSVSSVLVFDTNETYAFWDTHLIKMNGD